ncbi:hypothetical protein ACH5RR_031174 [Cinchona calisaya]|uniref:MSP domain-containing protein n=1 Tax=Cinchona calisaya TaxID=153742 RepID=A0ABD2YHG6_9GENT
MSMEQLDVEKPGVKKQLLDVQPRELKFTFEVKKQSSCAVHLVNVSDHYVVFKVKTTSPKKYCVRPNVGVIKPKSAYDFTVTIQAQNSAPSDMQCKDKFLIQSTVAPFGTTEEDIAPGIFAKVNGKYVEECKLKLENSFEDEKLVMDAEVLSSAKVVDNVQLPARNVKLNSEKDVGLRALSVIRGTKLEFSRDIEELKSKIITLDSELTQVMLRTNTGSRKVDWGFPPLLVCMVAFISLTVGFLLHDPSVLGMLGPLLSELPNHCLVETHGGFFQQPGKVWRPTRAKASVHLFASG